MAESKMSKNGTPPAALFQGYNSVTGNGYNTAIQGESTTTGGDSSVSCHLCTDVESLSQALEVDESLSVSYGPIGSMSQKMQYIHNLNITTTSVTLVVYARHVTGVLTKTNATKKDDVKVPETTEELKNFFTAYGDSYIASITNGGEYYATYTFYSQTKDEQTQVTSSLQMSGVYEGVSVDASLQTKISTATSKTSTRMSFDQRVSGIANPHLPQPANIIQYALDFPSQTVTSPAIIAFTTSGYEDVPEIATKFNPIATVRSYFIGDNLISGLTAQLVKLQQLRNSIAYLKDIHAFYGFTDGALNNAGTEADSDLKVIDNQILAYNQNPTQMPQQPNLPSLQLGTPELSYNISNSPAYGGGGGDPWDDLDINSYLQQKTWISAIQLKTGSRVDHILVTYTSQKGVTTVEHGGGGGDWQGKLVLQEETPPQRITQINGRSGSRVDHLTFTCSDGRQANGGGGGGNPFTAHYAPPNILLGFRGRAGSEIDQIQFVSAILHPANWRK